MAAAYLKTQGVDLEEVIRRARRGMPIKHKVTRLLNVRLPQTGDERWDVSVSQSKITTIERHSPSLPTQNLPSIVNAEGGLLAPALCHAHVHLDKCHLLSDPKYKDLKIIKGDFEEAMSLTNTAKSRFDSEDLLKRGRRLVEQSLEAGVGSMRAFVEVDEVVGLRCLEAAIELRREFSRRCEIQICAFAQLALFSSDQASIRKQLLEKAAAREELAALGSTPYVEDDLDKGKQNIDYLLDLAEKHDKFADFHLDYHLDSEKEPLVWHVITTLEQRPSRQVTLGHCTRLTLFTRREWQEVAERLRPKKVAMVGLPTSDLFMMDRLDADSRTLDATRGTLRVPTLIHEFQIQAAIAVNNVGNAFTPQGSCDPLQVASLGVGLYQASSQQAVETLYECVSTRARAAIGLESAGLELQLDSHGPFVLYQSEEMQPTIASVVYDPSAFRRLLI